MSVITSPHARRLLRDLAAYWPLDEASGNRRDMSGNASTLTDNATVTGNPGPSQKLIAASQFAAANSEYLSAADSAILSTGNIDFSLCGWLYPDSLPVGNMWVVGRWATAPQNEYVLYLNGTSDVLTFLKTGDGTVGVDVAASTFGALSSATWYFWRFWHDPVADTINIQVNNGAINTTSTTTGVFDSTSQFEIGRNQDQNANFWDGRQAGVGFWKRVLTAAESTYLYNRGAGRMLRPGVGFV